MVSAALSYIKTKGVSSLVMYAFLFSPIDTNLNLPSDVRAEQHLRRVSAALARAARRIKTRTSAWVVHNNGIVRVIVHAYYIYTTELSATLTRNRKA